MMTAADWEKAKEGIILMPEPTYNSIVFCIPCEAEIQNTYVLKTHFNCKDYSRPK
jgi:hypothetical protein